MIRKTNRFMNNENGVTLVEVLASMVIISIILLGVYSLMTFTNKHAVSNNAKLVSINLAKATIERIKIKPEEYFDVETLTEEEFPAQGYTFNADNCTPKKCSNVYLLEVNDTEYKVEIYLTQDEDERDLKLINVIVTISLEERNINSVVEGYVNYATYE